MIAGARVTQVVAVFVQLGIPALLADGGRTAGELAAATATHPPSLSRLLRALTALGLVARNGESFVLTELGETLRPDTVERLDLQARYMTEDVNWRTWGALSQSIETGKTAFEKLFGKDPWTYREEHPESSRLFNELMAAQSRHREASILAAYDFSRFPTIVDIGGGQGQLLGAILARHGTVSGVLFDQPHVVPSATEPLSKLGVLERCTLVGGSFFEAVPPNGDLYVMKFVIHDWEDEDAVRILSTTRRAMGPSARLLVMERVIDETSLDPNVALMDLHMLVQLGGRERTAAELQALFERAGFRLEAVTATASDVVLVEGIVP